MKTTINTTAAGQISINSTFLNNKSWSGNEQNWNNHKITILHNGKKISFEFWGSIQNPEITTDEENIFALYCFLRDSEAASNSFKDFCNEFGYDEDSRRAEKIYKSCEKSLKKFNHIFNCDLYDLLNELQETYNC